MPNSGGDKGFIAEFSGIENAPHESGAFSSHVLMSEAASIYGIDVAETVP